MAILASVLWRVDLDQLYTVKVFVSDDYQKIDSDGHYITETTHYPSQKEAWRYMARVVSARYRRNSELHEQRILLGKVAPDSKSPSDKDKADYNLLLINLSNSGFNI